MKLSTTVRLFNRMFLFKFQSMKIPRESTAGLSARIPHTTKFVIFLDYDNIEDERLMDELGYLQELHGLGDFHVIATNEFARHAICIDNVALKEAVEVVYDSSCDAMFKRGIRINEYRTWILRGLGKGERPKPKYAYTVKSPLNGKRLQSQAHGEFLQRYYDVPVRLVKPDGNEELEIQGYKTANKTSLEDARKK